LAGSSLTHTQSQSIINKNHVIDDFSMSCFPTSQHTTVMMEHGGLD